MGYGEVTVVLSPLAEIVNVPAVYLYGQPVARKRRAPAQEPGGPGLET